MHKILFGTDGIRAIFNVGLTADMAFNLGKALSYKLLKDKKNQKIIVGEDTRISSDSLKFAFISGFLSCGGDVVDVGKITTPAISFLTLKFNFSSGVVITASHSGFEYNGVKIFNNLGEKISCDDEKQLEEYANNSKDDWLCKSQNLGKYTLDLKLVNYYLHFLYKTFKKKINLRVCFDLSNGVTKDIAKKVFPKICDATFINDSDNPLLVNASCGATDLSCLKNEVLSKNYDLGIAFDGDGDRIIIVDKFGKIINGDSLLYIFAKYMKDKGTLKNNTVIGTLMTNFGLQVSLTDLGINLIREDVGDKWIQRRLKQEKCNLGGEQSGHIILYDFMPSGDGIFTAINLFKILYSEKSSVTDYLNDLKEYPQVLINVPVSEVNKNCVLLDYDIINAIKNVENELILTGRVLVRTSGTENMVRILCEGQDFDTLNNLANILANKIKDYNLKHC